MTNNNYNNNNLGSHEGRVTATNTPSSTPVIITPKITLEDNDLDNSDDDQETLIAYASSSSNKSSSSSNYPSKPVQVPVLKVDHLSDSRPDTPSEQLSTNESEVSSLVEEKNESESGETQSRNPAKKKDQILAMDEYGFVYDVAEGEDGVDRMPRMFVFQRNEKKKSFL